MYEIIFSDSAEKQLKKLERVLQERIISSLDRIRIRPEAFLTRLVGKECYKFRVGDYRIIIDLDQDRLIILVIEIGHRKKVYN